MFYYTERETDRGSIQAESKERICAYYQ